MNVCKEIKINETNIDFSQDCSCTNPTLLPIIYPDNYITSSADFRMYDYSATQYIIEMPKPPCTLGMIPHIPHFVKGAIPYSIYVNGANPANVSFVVIPYLSTVSYSWTNLFGDTYSKVLTGLCMIVDKDPIKKDIPKASLTNVVIKQTPTSIPFSQIIKTEQFHNFNVDFLGANHNGVVIPLQVYTGTATTVWVSGDAEDLNNGTYRVPIALEHSTGGFFPIPIPYISIQDIRVVGVQPNSLPNPGVTFSYDNNLGLWFAIIPKYNNSFYGTVNNVLDLELEVDYYLGRSAGDIVTELTTAPLPTNGWLKKYTLTNVSKNLGATQWK